jgi:hypothetical protein
MTQDAQTESSQENAGRASGAATNQNEVQQLLDQFARALTAGEAGKVAALWETPALVMSDQAVQAVGATSEVESFFAGAKDQYNDMGITDTRPEIRRLTWATDRTAIVEVRWPWLNADGRESGSETSTYTLRRDDAGKLKVRVVVMHGVARND